MNKCNKNDYVGYNIASDIDKYCLVDIFYLPMPTEERTCLPLKQRK